MPAYLESAFHAGMVFSVHLLEIMGASVIFVGAARDFILYFTGKATNVRLDLARSLALGLEFKLGSEILRTVLVRDLRELLFTGAIILLRGALSFLIHWEIHHMEKDDIP